MTLLRPNAKRFNSSGSDAGDGSLQDKGDERVIRLENPTVLDTVQSILRDDTRAGLTLGAAR